MARVITQNAASALSLVLRDFAGTPAADADTQLIDFDPAHPELCAELIPGPAGWIDHSTDRDRLPTATACPPRPPAHRDLPGPV